jgi:hypothetical protein
MKLFAMILALGLAVVAAGPAAVSAQEPALADCESDFDCFVRASTSCEPTRVVRTIVAEGEGVVLAALTRFELRGVRDDRCVLYERTEQATLRFDPDSVAHLRSIGWPDQQIGEQEEALSQAYSQMTVGVDGTCSLPPGQLSSLLQLLNSGDEIQFDAYLADCEGPLFRPRSAS